MEGTLIIGPIDVAIIVAYIGAFLVLNWFRKHHLGGDE